MNSIKVIGTGLCLAVTLLTLSTHAQDPSQDKLLYVVSTAHLDTQWNWTIQDTINSFIPATLSANFDFFNRYPHYTFSFEGAFRYRLAKEYYPAEYMTLAKYIGQGRWRVTGSAVDACDVNIPSPESLIRQALYGNLFWEREFNKTSVDVFLPDCFGFGYALPSIAAHCGLKGFSSWRVSEDLLIPKPFQNIGRWIGPDGASIVAVISPGSYGSSIDDNLANDATYYSRINNMYAASGLYLDYKYFGTGDTGGGPTEASVNWLEQSVNTTNGLVTVLSQGADQMFRDLTPSQIAQLPSYQGELLGTLGSGSYTTHPELKKFNRQNEQRADAAERILTIANWLQGGGTYPAERLNTAWERFLWHQFHDDICGTSIPAAYTFTWNDDLLSLNDFAAMETFGAGVLAEALDTTAEGVPLVVYNPLSIAREDVVEALVTFTNTPPAAVRVFDWIGNEVPSQMGAFQGNRVQVTFLASMPAMSVFVFDVRPSETPCTLDTGLSVSSSQLENSHYRVQIDAHGDVSSIIDKVQDRQLLHAPVRWDFLPDSGNAWVMDYTGVASAPSYLEGPPIIQVVEKGPARACLSITRNKAGSTITEHLRLGSGGAEDRLEWDVTANWRSPRTLLKVEFPLAVTNNMATFDLGLGTVQRGNATSSIYEVPAQQWADLTSSNSAYGVTIMNDSKIGWDKPNSTTLRLTLFHNPAMGSDYGYQATNGFGTHRILFAIMGHTNDWSNAGSPWVAARLNQPLQAFQTVSHTGILNRSFCFLSCDNPNVMVKALKKAENSEEIVVRLQELSGQPQIASLGFTRRILTVRQITGMEDPIKLLTSKYGTVTVSLGAYQPVAIAVTLAPPYVLQPTATSMPLALPFNLDAISTDANRTDGNFVNGYTYPAEQMSAVRISDGVQFELGPTNNGYKNALICQGQTLTINGSDYDHLCLLAAATTNTVGEFAFLPAATSLRVTVPAFTGFFGQWYPPSLLPGQEVAWVCTHRHDGKGHNNAYNFCYLFKYDLKLPTNTGALVLPNNPAIRIFAATLARGTTADTLPAGGPLAEKQLLWANAGPSQIVSAPTITGPATVTLDGSASINPDGSPLAYAWSINGLPFANGIRPVVTLPLGTNAIYLTVTDDYGQTAMDATTVIVVPSLTLSISATPTNGATAPLTVQFTSQAVGGDSEDCTDDHSGIVTAQGENSGSKEVAVNAFDDITGTKWLDFANVNPATRSSWIQYQFSNNQKHTVVGYTITTANDATSYPGRNPANWRLLGSNNGGALWTTLDIQTGQTFAANFQKRSYSLTNLTAFNVYRFQIDRVIDPSAGCLQLDELEFLAYPPPYSYLWTFGDGTTSTLQNPLHTYTNTGTYTATCAARSGIRWGTNTIRITVGPELAATMTATPSVGAAPLNVQFSAQASGGRANPILLDATEDHLGVVTAQGENTNAGEVAANAFDDTTGTKWLDFANDYPATRQSWIQYQYSNGARYAVCQYTVTSANDATTYPGRNPADWRLLGSNDDGTFWITLDTQTNQAFYANFEKHSHPIGNAESFNIYRFQIDRIADPSQAGCVQLDELEFLYRPAPYSYSWMFGDGGTSTLQNPQHSFTNNGDYLVTLVASDGLSTTSTTLLLTLAPPALQVRWMDQAGMLAMDWPGWASGYHLYFTDNLSPPITWNPVTNAVTLLNNTNSILVPIGQKNGFFQLRNP